MMGAREIFRAVVPEPVRLAFWRALARLAFWRAGADCQKRKSQVLAPLRFATNLFSLLFGRRPVGKNILGVWDLKCVPWSVGDFLVFIETLSVIKIRFHADKIDICVLCDSENPTGLRRMFHPKITPSNFRQYLFALLPAIITSPYLGSVYQFDSRSDFNRFITDNHNRYILFPPIHSQLARTYNFFGGTTLREIQDFHKDFGYVPHLTVPEYSKYWAYNLYSKHLKDRIPIALALKSTPHSTNRNADLKVWRDFIELCDNKYPEVGFIVIGWRDEDCSLLRQLNNVVIAKDYGSTLADDLAIIRTSLLFMGMSSGISTIALFSYLPYLLFGCEDIMAIQTNIEIGSTWSFATEKQKLFYDTFEITPESLMEEFSKLYENIDKDAWGSESSKYKKQQYFYPSGF